MSQLSYTYSTPLHGVNWGYIPHLHRPTRPEISAEPAFHRPDPRAKHLWPPADNLLGVSQGRGRMMRDTEQKRTGVTEISRSEADARPAGPDPRAALMHHKIARRLARRGAGVVSTDAAAGQAARDLGVHG